MSFLAAFGSLPSLYQVQVRSFVNEVVNPQGRSFFLLATLGQRSLDSQSWIDDFTTLGVLHYLLFSGAQIRSLFVQIEGILGFLLRDRPPIWRRLSRAFLALFVFLIVGWSSLWMPAVTRALLSCTLRSFVPRLRFAYHAGICLLVQCSFFPEHLLKPGFYLAWLATLSMELFLKLRWPALARGLLLALVCRGALHFLKTPGRTHLPPLNFVIVSNLSLALVLESCVLPVIGAVLALGLLQSLLPGFIVEKLAPLTRLVASPILNGTASVILVARRAFMYIH